MKKFFVFLLVVICLGMGAGVVYMKSSEDNEGPKITFEEGKDTNYTSDMTEEDLLKAAEMVLENPYQQTVVRDIEKLVVGSDSIEFRFKNGEATTWQRK